MIHMRMIRNLMLLLAVCISGCAIPIGGIIIVHSTPVSLKAGEQQQTEFVVELKQTYSFELWFEFKDAEDRARVAALVGREYEDKSGKMIRVGVPTPVRLTVKRLEGAGAKEVYSAERNPRPTGSTSSTYGKNIAAVPLTPGRYVVTLTPLVTPDGFERTPVRLGIFYDTSFLP